MSEFLVIVVLGFLAGIILGLTLGFGFGRKHLWKQLKESKRAHVNLDYKYDPAKKEISINGTHRVPAIIYTKKQLSEVMDKKELKRVFKDEIKGQIH